MRIAIVNDVRLAVEVLRRVVVCLPEADVAWVAENGKEALEKCRADRPDLVLMDLIMPVMDGVQATGQIMQQCPCPILVVTATVKGNAGKVYEALGHGALDAVNTPVLGRGGDMSGAEDLARKIRDINRLQSGGDQGWVFAPSPAEPARSHGAAQRMEPLVAIGASTGGPQAIASVLAPLERPLPFAVVVVQHLDPLFVPGLAAWLSQETGLSVSAVREGERPVAGSVHVACTADHMVLRPSGALAYVRQPADHVYRPSVDVLFDSLGKSSAPAGVAVLLTGMGRDGAAGLKALRQSGWTTIAQDQATSIVWGMPGAAVQLGAACRVLPLEEIGAQIAKQMSRVRF